MCKNSSTWPKKSENLAKDLICISQKAQLVRKSASIEVSVDVPSLGPATTATTKYYILYYPGINSLDEGFSQRLLSSSLSLSPESIDRILDSSDDIYMWNYAIFSDT